MRKFDISWILENRFLSDKRNFSFYAEEEDADVPFQKKLKNGAITPLDTILRPLVQCLKRQIGTFLLKKVLNMNVNGL